ncbi:sodium/proton antiporter (CPA1 family) [Saccharothrix carnea]|uniref:Sodium/proton antiporter (CPA1 family) n=1 Tax=Saccharothrix carnea TaxID=1280637 RepID=A0A2P8IG12_SACCR|nr:sodium/proton antiporter (CPA1 family) [Saccharothrix carnea]
MVCAVGGLAAAVLALVSRAIHRLPFSGPLAALLLGIVLGPQLLGLLELEPELRDTLLLEGARLLLAGSVMTAALRFPTTALSALVRPLVLLLVVVMPLAALAAGAAALLLGLPLALAALVGACLCPTDPVLAASVITGEPAERDLPGRIRALLTGESGANDGLALPLVGIALAVVLPATHLGDAFGKVAWEVAGGVVIGLLAGLAAGWALRAATRHRDLEEGPKLVFPLLLAVSVLGIARLAGTGGVLAVFVAGLAYNRMVAESDRGPQDAVDEAVNRYAVLPLFLVFGAVLPWRDWIAFGPAAIVFVIAILLVRRLPFILVLARPLRLARRDALFAGWFGPIGVSALFYLAHSVHEGAIDPRLFAAGTLAVAAHTAVYGLTATLGRKLYAKSRSADPPR